MQPDGAPAPAIIQIVRSENFEPGAIQHAQAKEVGQRRQPHQRMTTGGADDPDVPGSIFMPPRGTG